MLDDAGRLRDLSYVLYDLGPEHLGPDDLDILRSIEPETLPPVEGARPIAVPLSGIRRLFVDGEERPVAAIRPASETPGRIGLAAAVGAPGFAGAFMSARLDPDGAWVMLGPWLTAPDRPLRLNRLTARAARLTFAPTDLDALLQTVPDAGPGDVLVVCSDVSGAFHIDGFGA